MSNSPGSHSSENPLAAQSARTELAALAQCTPSDPGSHLRLGILGAGQLGRMLALAAIPMGVECRFLATAERDGPPPPGACFNQTNTADEQAFACGLSAVTTEYEAVDPQLLARLQASVSVWPPVPALVCKRDRRAERRLLATLALPQPKWTSTGSERTQPANNPNEVRQALRDGVREIGLPCRVKAAFGGYDGRGQWAIRAHADVEQVDVRAGPFVIEAEVPFAFEFSLLGAFAGAADPSREHEHAADSARFWTPTINTHVHGILLRSQTADGQLAVLLHEAERIAETLAGALSYRGVLAIEFFCVGGQLLINEFAPRVHNTGHWTIEGAHTSQFANHVRAVLGLPLGVTTQRCACVSWNVLGQWPDKSMLLRIPGLHLHDYQKPPRPGRKLGHVTLTDATPDDPRVEQVERLLATLL